MRHTAASTGATEFLRCGCLQNAVDSESQIHHAHVGIWGSLSLAKDHLCFQMTFFAHMVLSIFVQHFMGYLLKSVVWHSVTTSYILDYRL